MAGRTDFWDYEQVFVRDAEDTETWVFYHRNIRNADDEDSQVHVRLAARRTSCADLVPSSTAPISPLSFQGALLGNFWHTTLHILLQEKKAPARAAGTHPSGRGCEDACRRINEWAEAASPRKLQPAERIVPATRSSSVRRFPAVGNVALASGPTALGGTDLWVDPHGKSSLPSVVHHARGFSSLLYAATRLSAHPPWRQPRGKFYVNLPQMPPNSGGIRVGVD